MYKKIILLSIMTLGLFSNCYNLGYLNGFGPPGGLYSGYKIGLSSNNNPSVTSTKVGKACVRRYFIIATSGDASVNEAALEANIKDIKSVDREVLNILGLYTQACTVVKGN